MKIKETPFFIQHKFAQSEAPGNYPLELRSCGGDIGSVLHICMYVRMLYVRTYVVCTCVCTHICTHFVIALTASFLYNFTQLLGDRVKVKVAEVIFRKTLSLL